MTLLVLSAGLIIYFASFPALGFTVQNMDIDWVSIALRLVLAIVVLFTGRWLAGRIRNLLGKSLKRTDLTESLITLIVTLCYYSILVVTVRIALAILGVPTTTIVGVVGIFIVVLAIALQQSLGSLAATVNFLLFKPFEVGHIIETGGVMGVRRSQRLLSSRRIPIGFIAPPPRSATPRPRYGTRSSSGSPGRISGLPSSAAPSWDS